MLQLEKISKEYRTGDLVQKALDQVDINFRESEFVAILGPSGSGKTTLLNIIGGLDRYDSGDLIIRGNSTKKYKDRDWDSYRNHTIGFVFQSYNLIPHQSVLANVELALTISGVSRGERRQRAKEALEKVGLGEHLHKRPNQLSGGQMQRVAIARALINNPDILLADEPTGALDTETSLQVMELLQEVAKDRLVVMVTHNPELAENYATRIVRLRDGKIMDDSNPYLVDTTNLDPPTHKNLGKASMSFLTALSLSFNNLRTKKGRTLLTAFAGSIGIIGIALILALSNGVNNYINDIQESTMLSYPITIEAQTFDLASMMAAGHEKSNREVTHEKDGVYSNSRDVELAANVVMSFTKNNLTDFKKYLDNPDNEIHQYLGENGINYSYPVKFDVYTYDPEDVLINTDGVVIEEDDKSSTFSRFRRRGMGDMSSMGNMGNMGMMGSSSGNFAEMLPGQGEELISAAIKDNYDLLYGKWPQDYREVILVLDKNNEIPLTTLYELGMLPSAEYKELVDKIENGEEIAPETIRWNYEDFAGKTFYLLPASAQYEKKENGRYIFIGEDPEKLPEIMDEAIELKVVGVIRPTQESETSFISGVIGYTQALTDYLIDYTDSSPIVKDQKAQPEVNILNGLTFSPADEVTKIQDTIKYLSGLNISEKASFSIGIMRSVYGDDPQRGEMLANMSEAELAGALDQYLENNPDDEVLLNIYDNYISTGTYEDNMAAFGVVSLDAPSTIRIYAKSFEDKDRVAEIIQEYNASAAEENQIRYTDYVGLLMSSVTTIVNVVSYVLIGFVAVSLVVSSIMIGIITYISVLERTKEIGILRAIGASKQNISQVFNAETFIIGLGAGIIGIGITLLLLIPGNAIIHQLVKTTDVNASLPASSGVILIILSVILTLLGGLIPSRKAAKKDPVTALRTE